MNFDTPTFRFLGYIAAHLTFAVLLIILGFFVGFYYFLRVFIEHGYVQFLQTYNSYNWSAVATLIAATIATASAAAAIRNSHYQRQQDQKDLTKMLAYESLDIVERVEQMFKWLEENNKANTEIKFHALYMPMGFEDSNFMAKIKPADALRIGKLRRYIKTYQNRTYNKGDVDRFFKERDGLLKEFEQFLSNWRTTFGSIKGIKGELKDSIS